MSVNPNLRIFSANGWFDFATPFFGDGIHARGHMGLDSTLEEEHHLRLLPSAT